MIYSAIPQEMLYQISDYLEEREPVKFASANFIGWVLFEAKVRSIMRGVIVRYQGSISQYSKRAALAKERMCAFDQELQETGDPCGYHEVWRKQHVISVDSYN